MVNSGNDNNETHKTPIPSNKLSDSDSKSLDRENGMTGHSSNSDLTESTVEKENSKKSIIIKNPESDKVSLSDDSDNVKNINNLSFANLSPVQTKKRKERKERKDINNNEKDDDNNSEVNLISSPPLDISDSDNEIEENDDEDSVNNDSEKRRKIIKEEEIKKISLCSFSWTCSKCNNLNSQKARSCDICGIKKPSVQVPPKKKIEEKIFVLGVRQKQKPGRKPKIKVIENEELNMNNTQNSNLIKDVDKLSIIE